MKKLLLSAFVLSAGFANAQWEEQATSFSTPTRGISTIDIFDANVVWCTAYDGTAPTNEIFEFTKTADGGATWVAGNIDLGDELLDINNLEGISGDKAWVSAINGDLGGGMLFTTEDGGMLWEGVNPVVDGQVIGSFTYPASFQNGVHFFDANTGIVFGDPVLSGTIYDYEIYRTTDGGASWTRTAATDLPNAANASEYGYNGGNVGAGSFFWMVTNTGKLYRNSTMGSGAWTKLDTPITNFGSAAVNGRVVFSDVNGSIGSAVGMLVATINGSAATPTYTRYLTTDGGTTWSAGTTYTGFRNGEFIPGTTMLVANAPAPDFGTVYSTDFGTTWTPIDTGVQRTAIAFLDGSTGWSGGFNEDATAGGIFKYVGPALSVPGVSEKAQFSASPNPTNGLLQVANQNANITDVVVYDLLGKKVFNSKFNSLNEVSLDLSSLTSGAYILTATADNGAKQTIKIMKN